MPTHIGTNAEPVLFFYKFFLLFFFFFYLYGVWWLASIQPICSHPSTSKREWAYGRGSSGRGIRGGSPTVRADLPTTPACSVSSSSISEPLIRLFVPGGPTGGSNAIRPS